ncbi:MAG: alpha-amylase family protein [Propionibacterium sp.]
MPSWQHDVIWWSVYPLGFTGAPVHPDQLGAPTPPEQVSTHVDHRLPQLEKWLDYLVELGCNGLALGPVFASVSHGYDTLDYYRIDPRLGDEADFEQLARACHERGVKLLLDGVFNHVSSRYPQLLKALAEGPDGSCADMFHIDFGHNPPIRLNFEGSDDLVVLNHSSASVSRLVTDVMTHWLARGADGWRLDAAYAVDPDFWAPVLAEVRRQFPEVLVVGEVIHGDYVSIVERSGMDSLTQYELWKACWSSLESENFFELAWTLDRHNDVLDHFQPLTFVGNHDVTRIASKVGADKAVLAAVLLLTLGGMPSIYYGDEQAFRGTKYERPGGDDEVRPAMPELPGQLSRLGEPTHRVYQQLLALRRRHGWLARAHSHVDELANKSISYRLADSAVPDHWLSVSLDVTTSPTARIRDEHGELFSWQA